MSKRCGLFIGEYIFLSAFLLSIAFIFQDNFNLVIWISLFQLVIIVGTIYFYKKDYLLITILFILLTYLFHFGQSLIIIFNFNDIYSHRNVLSKTTNEIYITAELFSMLSLFFIGLGFLFSHKTSGYVDQLKGEQTFFLPERLEKIRQAGYLVLLISIIPAIYIDLSKIIALKSGSYMDTYSVYTVGIGKYLGLIAQFAKPAMTIILFSYVRKRKKATIALFLSTIYLLVMMLSGDRSTNIIYIIVNFFVYFKFIRKIRKREIILGLVCCYIGFAFLSTISMFRDIEFSLDALINTFGKRANDGIIYSVLREFGGSLLTLVYAFEFIPSYSGFNYGLTYLAGLVTILPKVPAGIDTLLTNSYAFVTAFPEIYQESLGGSFLGELYYNFGWGGTVVAALIGYILGKMDLKLVTLKEPRYIAMLLVIVPNVILWVRDYYCTIFFKGFWFALFLTLF